MQNSTPSPHSNRRWLWLGLWLVTLAGAWWAGGRPTLSSETKSGSSGTKNGSSPESADIKSGKGGGLRPNAVFPTTHRPKPDVRPAPKTLAALQEQLGFPDLLDYFLSGAKAPAAITDWAANLTEPEFRSAMEELKALPLSTGKYVVASAVLDRWLKADPQGCLDALMKFTGGAGQELLDEASGKWKNADAEGFDKWVQKKQADAAPAPDTPPVAEPVPGNTPANSNSPR